MFQSARPNGRAYIFFKGKTPHLEQGYMTNVSAPRPKNPLTPSFGMQQEMIVDVSVKTDTGIYTFNGIPTNIDSADTFCNGEAAVLSDNKDAMSAEISAFRQRSVEALEGIDYHKAVIPACDEALGLLNSEYAERQKRNAELSQLKEQVSTLSGKLDLLIEQMASKNSKDYE